MPAPRPLLWDDLQLLGTARLGASAPTLASYRGGIYGLEFSASATNEVHGSIELPHTYAEGTDLVPHVHFTTASTNAAGGGVRVGIEYCTSERSPALGSRFPRSSGTACSASVATAPTRSRGRSSRNRSRSTSEATRTGRRRKTPSTNLKKRYLKNQRAKP